MITVKKLAESPGLTSIPSVYTFTTHPDDQPVQQSKEPIPTVDFSLLTSGNPDQRSKIVQEIGRACRDWGFFMVINHGVPESLMKRVIDTCGRFFDLTDEEKRDCVGTHVGDPIRWGTSFNTSVEKVFFWRDYLKVRVHPQFHSPQNPNDFREIGMEFSTAVRNLQWELLRGISESLGLDADHINEALDVKRGFQHLVANLYPPCPEPELAMGMPPHSDHGLLTFLIQNGVGGLQLLRNGNWVDVDMLPNSFCVNICDQLEVLSNGKYKSVMHRAVVNNRTTRISVLMSFGPSLEATVAPSPDILVSQNQPPCYAAMTYKDYFELQQSNKLDGKSCLDHLRIPPG